MGNFQKWGDKGLYSCTLVVQIFLKNWADFAGAMSLFYNFHLRQFGSPFFGPFWLVPGFVEVEQVCQKLQRVGMLVTP